MHNFLHKQIVMILLANQSVILKALLHSRASCILFRPWCKASRMEREIFVGTYCPSLVSVILMSSCNRYSPIGQTWSPYSMHDGSQDFSLDWVSIPMRIDQRTAYRRPFMTAYRETGYEDSQPSNRQTIIYHNWLTRLSCTCCITTLSSPFSS